MDDTLKYVIHSTDGGGDFVTLPRKFVAGCAMKADAFDDVFFEFHLENRGDVAYEQAEQLHERIFGCRKYSDYGSFRAAKSQRNK